MPTLSIPKESPLHKKICAMIQSRIQMARKDRTNQETIWREAEERTLAYLPEIETDARRRNNRDGGKPQYTTIQLPYSYALLMSAHTYWTSVFFGRAPVHQFSGRHGESEMQVQALEALIDYQMDVGQMLGPQYIWFYDAGKYGAGILGEYWDVEKISYGQLTQMPNPETGVMGLYQATVELEGYRGNKVYNVNPFDFWWDPRVPLKHFQQGEYCAVMKRMIWNDVLRRVDSGYYMKENMRFLRQHATARLSDDNSSQLKRPDWAKTDLTDAYDPDGKNVEATHPAAVFAYEFYVDLIPKEWGVGPESFPQKWCFTITEDFGLIIGASPLGMMHAKFPFSILESEVEGYSMYSRGIPEIVSPLQNTMDWLINTHFYNVRASLNNQFIVDPSKLVLKDVEAGEPGFIWRLRPEAFGTDINSIFKQIPVTDVTRGNMTDLQQMFGLGERTLGINDQIMGVLNTGGRKTATEIRTAAGFGTNRLKTNTEYMSAMGFSRHSMKLVQNSQQFYDGEKKFRIVGDLTMAAGPQFMNVTPDQIMGFFNFSPVDGTLPVDRAAQANLWKDMMSNLRMMPPQVAMGYDWVKIFSWVGSLDGLKNINQFKIQVVDGSLDGQVQQMLFPFRQLSPPGANSSTVSGNNAMAPPPPRAYVD
jgi:hypothetical protein